MLPTLTASYLLIVISVLVPCFISNRSTLYCQNGTTRTHWKKYCQQAWGLYEVFRRKKIYGGGEQQWSLKSVQLQFTIFSGHSYCLTWRKLKTIHKDPKYLKFKLNQFCIREGFHGQDLMVVVGFSGFLAVFWKWFFLTFRQSLWPASSEDSKLRAQFAVLWRCRSQRLAKC